MTVGNEEEVTAEGIFSEGVSDETEEAVEAFAPIDGVGGGEAAGGGGEAEDDQASRRRRRPSNWSAMGENVRGGDRCGGRWRRNREAMGRLISMKAGVAEG